MSETQCPPVGGVVRRMELAVSQLSPIPIVVQVALCNAAGCGLWLDQSKLSRRKAQRARRYARRHLNPGLSLTVERADGTVYTEARSETP